MEQLRCVVVGSTSLVVQCGELLKNVFELSAVISESSVVREWAESHGITTFTGVSAFEDQLLPDSFDYLFSIANPSVLSKDILRLPRLAAINFHDSLLPAYAGANATFWAIANQETTHGVTWHIMDDRLDSGDILIQKRITIEPEETTESLNIKCYSAAIASFSDLIPQLQKRLTTALPQNPAHRTYYGINRKLPGGGIINWQDCGERIMAMVRATRVGHGQDNTIGSAKLYIDDTPFLLKKAYLKTVSSPVPAGQIISADSSELVISTQTTDLAIAEILTIDGRPVKFAELYAQTGIATGTQLQSRAPEYALRMAEAQSNQGPFERFWVKRLQDIDPISLPYAQQEKGTGPVTNSIRQTGALYTLGESVSSSYGNKTPADLMLALWLCYLARIQDKECFDVGLRLPPSPSVFLAEFASIIPLRVELDLTSSISDNVHIALGSLDRARRRGPYPLDITARYPALQGISHGDVMKMLNIVCDLEADMNSANSWQAETCIFHIRPESHTCTLHYDTLHLSDENMQRISRQFSRFVRAAAESAEFPLFRAPILTEAELYHLTSEVNTTKKPYPFEQTVCHLFDETAAAHPDGIAIVTEHQSITYRELACQANQLACHLLDTGVAAGSLVGVCMDRSIEMVTAILATLKAGCAFVPIDQSLPEERISLILEDTGLRHILTQQQQKMIFGDRNLRCITVSDAFSAIDITAHRFPPNHPSPTDLAYIIYTSGSTGKPNGVMIEHASLANLIRSQVETYGFKPGTRILHFLSISFDAAIEHLFKALCSAATIHLVTLFSNTIGDSMRRVLLKHKIEYSAFPASLLGSLSEDEFCDLKTISVGGDACTRELVERWGKGRRFLNTYGPTETTICSTIADLTNHTGMPHIGRPIANTQAYVLNERLQVQPLGLPGELYIGGAGVARGYLNRPELNDTRFITLSDDHPLSGSRLYRTGDFVVRGKDGNLTFIGRKDNQVKIRGYRIELTALEAALLKHPGVRQTAAVIKMKGNGTRKLCAYVALHRDRETGEAELIEVIRSVLPSYYLPDVIQILPQLPLLFNNKIDRQRLCTMEDPEHMTNRRCLPPQNQTEQRLLEIWKSALGLHRVCVTEDFFDSGGDSLAALAVTDEVNRIFQTPVQPHHIYEHATIRSFAQFLHEFSTENSWNPIVPIQKEGSGKPVFFIHDNKGHLIGFFNLAETAQFPNPLYGIQPEATRSEETGFRSMQEYAAFYAEKLIEMDHEEGIILCGYSIGGFIAFEMARILRNRGVDVTLMIVDTAFSPRFLPFPLLNMYFRMSYWVHDYRQNFHKRGKSLLSYLGYRVLKNIRLPKNSPQAPQPAAVPPVQPWIDTSGYQMQPLDVEIIYFSAEYNTSYRYFLANTKHGWEYYTSKNFIKFTVPHIHTELLSKQHIGSLATRMRECLAGL